MTTRRIRWAVPMLALLLVACVPREALAFWGWIEELSGPGPFYGYQIQFEHFLCVVRAQDGTLKEAHIFGRSLDAIECMTDGDRIRAHLSVEVLTQARSAENDNFPVAVTQNGVRPIFFYRLHKIVDVGAGVGFNRFSGTGFGFTRWSLPLRARIFAPGLKSGSVWRSVHLQLQSDYFPGEFTSADFLAPPGFQAHKEFVGSVFIGVDVLRLLTALTTR